MNPGAVSAEPRNSALAQSGHTSRPVTVFWNSSCTTRPQSGHVLPDKLAKQAADATTPSATAYGRLCWMVPQLLGQLRSAVTAGIASGAQSHHDTAGLLRDTAGSYLSADDDSAVSIQRAGQRYE